MTRIWKAFAALCVGSAVVFSWPEAAFAEDDPPATAEPKHVLSEGTPPPAHCDHPDAGHPHDYQDSCNTSTVHKVRSPEKGNSSGNAELASKLANPSAPMLSLSFFFDVTQNSGSLPGAQQASSKLTFQPALPFPMPNNRGNLIFRPAFAADFSQPIPQAQADGSVAIGSQPAAFDNISLDTLYGKTWPVGIIFMGGANTVFPTHSKKALRAPWTFGPEIVLGYASKKTGNLWATVLGYTWSFPDHDQTLAGQYAYSINVSDKGWTLAAQPTFSYSRATKTLRFPLGIGVAKVGLAGKLPLKLGVQVWAYTPPPGGSSAEWTVRFTIAPVVRRPW